MLAMVHAGKYIFRMRHLVFFENLICQSNVYSAAIIIHSKMEMQTVMEMVDMIDVDMGGNVEMEQKALMVHEKILCGTLTLEDVKSLSIELINFKLYEWYFGTILNGVLVRLISPSFDKEYPLDAEKTREFVRIIEYLCSVDSGCDILQPDYYEELVLNSTMFLANQNKYVDEKKIFDIVFVATVSRMIALMYTVGIKINLLFFALFEHKRQSAAASLIQLHFLNRHWTPPYGKGYKRLLLQHKSGLRLMPIR